MGDEFSQAVEIIPGQFYFVWIKRPGSPKCSPIAAQNISFCIDDELLYEPFFADFGPLNLGKAHRFCCRVTELLQEAQHTGKKVFFYTGPHAQLKANAAVLVGLYQVLCLNKSTEEACRPLLAYKPYVPFRDASCGVSTFHLTVFDCVKGIQKARDVGFLNWTNLNSWSREEYEHYEQVENGDLNWIVPGKFVAFSGPAARGNEIVGYKLMTPEDYWDYFRKRGVTTIIRLNKKVYDRKRFTDGGFKHHEMYFPDGSCPNDAIILRFLDTVEAEPGAVAVHCKAGLGRTGVLICCYLMKHYRFTAEEVIGYIRICRPGSVIGPQQNFIREMEPRMWQEGDAARQRRGIGRQPGAHAPQPDLVVSGRSSTIDSDSKLGSLGSSLYSSRTDSTTSSGISNASDLSLLQYKLQYGMNYSSGSSSSASSSISISTPMSSASPSFASNNTSSSIKNRYSQRSITPLRYGVPSTRSSISSIASLGQAYNVSASHPAPASAQLPIGSFFTRSVPTAPGRAASTDRSAMRTNSAGLRATLHTETLQAADRPRALPERNTQSADITTGGSHSWKLSTAPANMLTAPSTPPQRAASSGRAGGGGGVARVLAPNGQPRKVPMQMLGQYQGGVNRPASMPTGLMASSVIHPDRMKNVAALHYGVGGGR